MGKFVGLIGSVRGKVGNVVFSKGENGISYGRTYQPQVANPKTIGQVSQRAKMNLVGRMSQVTPSELLITLGGSKRMRRAEFNKMLLGVATLDSSTPGVVVAKVAPEDVIFSRGTETLQATVSSNLAVAGNTATIGLTLGDSTLAGKYGERIIIAVIDPSDKAGYSLIRYADVVFDNTTAKTITITLGQGLANGSLVGAYRVPYMLTEEGAGMRSQTLANDGTDIIAKLLVSGNYVKNWGSSILSATQVFTQA